MRTYLCWPLLLAMMAFGVAACSGTPEPLSNARPTATGLAVVSTPVEDAPAAASPIAMAVFTTAVPVGPSATATRPPAGTPDPRSPPTTTPLPPATDTPLVTPAPSATPPTETQAPPVTPTPKPTRPPADAPAPAVGPTATPEAVNDPSAALTLPAGFQMSVFTPQPIGPLRFMAFSPDGILMVSMPSRRGLYSGGRVGGTVYALPDRDRNGRADEVIPVIAGLGDLPHGLAFYDGYLYLAEEHSVSRYPYLDGGEVGPREVIVENLTSGPGHVSRTVAFGGSNKMYVSIGSSCNVCEERDQRRATIMEFSPDGTGERMFAQGLRNSVGFVFHPVTDEIWATENGRDGLGDDVPPDEVNIIREGRHYGWPFCFGHGVPDPAFDDATRCATATESTYDIQAHSAPLGLRFIDSPMFPAEWHGDLLVAYHGSWNRSEPTGYKVVRMVIDESEIVSVQDFIYGWLLDDGQSAGRPVDLIFDPYDGALYVSDDKAGVIYRVTRGD